MDTGTFKVYVLTTPEKIDSVKEIVSKELENLRNQEISAEDLQAVKSYLKGSKARVLATNSILSYQAAIDELYGLGYNYYQKFSSQIDPVTTADIRRIANNYLDMSKAVIVTTRPKTEHKP